MDKKNSDKRIVRARSKIRGTKAMPRLSVFRSNRHVYAQVINDENGETLFGMSEKHIENEKGKKIERARALGIAMAKKAVEKRIKKIVFDKGSYKFHGRVKALAEGAREGGLQF